MSGSPRPHADDVLTPGSVTAAPSGPEPSHAEPGAVPGDLRAARTAPFALLRVASLAYDDLVALAPPRTGGLLDQLIAATDWMERLRPELESSLHTAVSRADAPGRAALLRLRRAVHRGGLNAQDPGPTDGLMSLLSDECGDRVREWVEARRLTFDLHRRASETLHEEVTDHIRPGLLSIATQEAFLQPLALATLTLAEAVRRGELSGATGLRSSKLERKLLAYAMRAAAKTSPFSTFMHHAIVRVGVSSEGGLPGLSALDRRSRSYLSRSLIAALHRAAFGCCGRVNHATFALNPSLRWLAEDLAEVLRSSPRPVGTRLWRSDRAVRFRFHRAITSGLRGLPSEFRWDELCDALRTCGLAPDAAPRFALRLFETEVVYLRPVTDGTDEHPEERYEEVLQQCGSPAARSLRASLRRMARRASAFAEMGAADRVELLHQTRLLFGLAWRRLSPSPPPERLNMIVEEGYFTRSDGPLGGPWVAQLDEVSAALRPFARLRSSYLRLRDLFRERFGEGGWCHDVVAFLCDASERCPFGALAPGPGDPDEPGPPAGRHIAVTVMIQFAADVGAPDGRWAVVNQVHPGCGWLTARHAAGVGAIHRGLRTSMRDWLRFVRRPCEPVDLILCGECNDLQAHPRLTDRVLVWPTEPHCDGPALDARDLVLIHDPVTGLLALRDAYGHPVSPVHLGGTLPSPSWGPKYWLTVIADPYWVGYPMDEWRIPADSRLDFEFRPRRTTGSVVLSRATWCLKADHLRRSWFSRGGIDRLWDVASHCREHAIPQWVYARTLYVPTQTGNGDSHKPLWVDTRNPFCLDLLEQTLDTSGWVAITEALPNVYSTPHYLEGRRYAAEFLIEMII